MTLPTFSGARDEIFSLFYADWQANTPALNNGSVVTVLWQGVDTGNLINVVQPYASVYVNHANSGQTTFGGLNGRRFTRIGLVSILIYAPLNRGTGIILANTLAVIARDSLEGKGTATGIWFRDTAIKEVGRTEEWFQVNVTSTFEYDEMK